jgi:hypothetical protein
MQATFLERIVTGSGVRSSRNSLAVRLKILLPGDRIELLQPILHGLAEVITAAAERAVTLLDEVAQLPGQRQRRASPLPSFTRCYVLTCIRA